MLTITIIYLSYPNEKYWGLLHTLHRLAGILPPWMMPRWMNLPSLDDAALDESIV